MDIETYISKNVPWNRLPPEVQSSIENSEEYAKKIRQYSIVNQLKYKDNLIRTVEKNQRTYYEQLLRYSREHYMLFPYHLSEYIINGMRITPFQYYQAILIQMIEQEKNYDTLPNFTAADCCRLMGIGRNQYIELMNQYKSSKKFLGMIKKPIKELLPSKPVDNLSIDFWWTIQPGYITEDDIKSMVTGPEKIIIDIILNEDRKLFPAGNFPFENVLSLYIKGLIYFDIIIEDHDLIYIPPLEGFVMNRTTGDYFETLLYKIFVSIDEKTTIVQLADVLQIDLELVKNAVSVYCRLGFAFKKNNDINVNNCHDSWLKLSNAAGHRSTPSKSRTFDLKDNFIDSLHELTDEEKSLPPVSTPINESMVMAKEAIEPLSSAAGHISPSMMMALNQTCKRIGLLYDSTLAAFLMMGNLTPGLKSHAVTMFEVGKLSDESMDNFVSELAKIEEFTIEDEGGEAERYFLHAIILCQTIQFLRYNHELTKDLVTRGSEKADSEKGLGLDLIRCESLLTLDQDSCERLLSRNYEFLIAVAPLSNETQIFTSDLIPYFGASSLANSIWFKIYLYSITDCGPASFLLSKGVRLTRLPEIFLEYDALMLTPWGRDSTVVAISNALIAINETAIYNPVLIQAYPHSGLKLTRTDTVYIPLPVLDGPERDPLIQRFLQHPAVQNLRKQINLNRICGYLTFINYHGDESKSETINTEHIDQWLIFDCHFGIPLFDRDLNQNVCQRIRSNRLFDKDKLKDLVESNRKLFQDIELFIKENVQILENNHRSTFHYHYHHHGQQSQQHYRVPLPQTCIWFEPNGVIPEIGDISGKKMSTKAIF